MNVDFIFRRRRFQDGRGKSTSRGKKKVAAKLAARQSSTLASSFVLSRQRFRSRTSMRRHRGQERDSKERAGRPNGGDAKGTDSNHLFAPARGSKKEKKKLDLFFFLSLSRLSLSLLLSQTPPPPPSPPPNRMTSPASSGSPSTASRASTASATSARRASAASRRSSAP